eukprot:TRINITY_DN21084_c0_g1_i1.p1 TRINITY_DN21084_c0_g1~~TRINITY_DN21084_c0_g1_i1.p1  ORF type:complete len:288 (+),score=35.40 TRINITY_DN21084_c0_g1_i1:53-865(+)
MADVQEERAAMRNESQAFERTLAKGKDGGLFRRCMESIRRSHTKGQMLRMGLVATGLLSDKNCYTEALIQFYVCTKALEERLKTSKSNIVANVRTALAKYNFVDGYEADLKQLLGKATWQVDVQTRSNPAAVEYCKYLGECDDMELVAAVYVLYGALIIGGGAAMEPRVKKRFGAVSLFQKVIGPGRDERKSEFIALYDNLLNAQDQDSFEKIVASTAQFMERNNALMLGMRKKPFWYYPLGVGVLAVLAGVGFLGCRLLKSRVTLPVAA